MPNLHAVNRRIVTLLKQAECEKEKNNQIDHMSGFMCYPDDLKDKLEVQTGQNKSLPPDNGDQDEEEIVASPDVTALDHSATSPRKKEMKLILGPTTSSKALRSVQRLPYIRGVVAVTHQRQGPLPKESVSSEEVRHRHDSSRPQQREKGISVELEARMKATRALFVARARHYMGCLYRQGAQIRPGQFVGNGTEDPNLYLDCCGLVRRCVLDLKKEFGFELGPWNQGYFFDTLPMKIAAQDLLPGDLIFTQGRYRDNKKKRPPHDIVHVEIFVGGRTGEGTIGARDQNGAVDEHDSWKFESKSYVILGYHLRSISTWLKGHCRSFCTEHSWDPVMARIAQKTGAAPAGALDEAAAMEGSAANPPGSSVPCPWEPASTSYRSSGRPDDTELNTKLREGMTKKGNIENGREPTALSTAARAAAQQPEQVLLEEEKSLDHAATGRGMIGGLKEDIESLGQRAAALSTFAQRRARELKIDTKS